MQFSLARSFIDSEDGCESPEGLIVFSLDSWKKKWTQQSGSLNLHKDFATNTSYYPKQTWKLPLMCMKEKLPGK